MGEASAGDMATSRLQSAKDRPDVLLKQWGPAPNSASPHFLLQTIDWRRDLAGRKSFSVRGDMLSIPIDDAVSRSACHQIGAGFECRIDLLPDHQMHFVQGVAAAACELEHAKSDHVTGFQTQHHG